MNSDTTMDETATHLRNCEEILLDPDVRRDRARVSALLSDDFFEFGASGRMWTRDEILDLLETEEYSSPSIEDFQCRRIADGAALVTYRSARTDSLTGQQSITLRSSIWTREPLGWQLRFHQGTRTI